MTVPELIGILEQYDPNAIVLLDCGNQRYPAHVFPVAECVHLREAFEAGAKWQARQSPWISVKDRLPDNNEMVLCRMKSNNAIVSGYIMKRLGHKPEVLTAPDFHFEDLLYYEPEAWMPIPEYNGCSEIANDH